MNKKQWQKSIRENEGYIFSDGTLNLEHLLITAGEFIQNNHFNKSKKLNYLTQPKNLYNAILDTMTTKNNEIMQKLKQNKYSIRHAFYYDEIEMKDERECEYSPHIVWFDFESFMQELAPNGYYFGSHEGDGACIGFFKLGGEFE